MSAGFIFNWTQGDLAGRIRVTNDPVHTNRDAAFRLSACSPALQTFLQNHDTPPSVNVTFDLSGPPNNLRATNVDSP
jgi:non-ribosomal peptide synthetase component F